MGIYFWVFYELILTHTLTITMLIWSLKFLKQNKAMHLKLLSNIKVFIDSSFMLV
jgi:hypothetical protein